MAKVQGRAVEGMAAPDLEHRRVVVVGPRPVFAQLQVRMAAKRLDDVDDPVAARTGLAVGQGVQRRAELGQGSAHRFLGVVQGRAADEQRGTSHGDHLLGACGRRARPPRV